MTRLIQLIVGAVLIVLLSTPASANRFNYGMAGRGGWQSSHTMPRSEGYMRRPEYRPPGRETMVDRPVVREYGRVRYGYGVRGYGGEIGRQVESQQTYFRRGHRHYESSYSTSAQFSQRHNLATTSHGCERGCCCGCAGFARSADPPEDPPAVGPVTISPTANIPANWQVIR